MKAEEFIEILEDLIDEHGNCKMVVSDFDYDKREWYNEKIEDVRMIKEGKNTYFKIFSMSFEGE